MFIFVLVSILLASSSGIVMCLSHRLTQNKATLSQLFNSKQIDRHALLNSISVCQHPSRDNKFSKWKTNESHLILFFCYDLLLLFSRSVCLLHSALCVQSFVAFNFRSTKIDAISSCYTLHIVFDWPFSLMCHATNKPHTHIEWFRIDIRLDRNGFNICAHISYRHLQS